MNEPIQLLKKINELAMKGVGGEATAARHKLFELLEKYDLVEEDLYSEDTELVKFTYKDDIEKMLLINCCAHIINTHEILFKKKAARSIYVELTKIQAIDLQTCYDHYRKEFKTEVKSLMTAFISKHGIFSSDVPDDYEPEPLDMDKMAQMTNLMRGMKSESWDGRRRLE